MADSEIAIEVVYARPDEQVQLRLQAVHGVTVEQALRLSGLLSRYSEINLDKVRVGVFGKIVALDTPLQAGDRVEIYRPLTVDPKEARRRRVRLKNLK